MSDSVREIHFKPGREWWGGEQGWGSCAKTSPGTQNMNVKSRLIPRHFFPKSIYCRAVCPQGVGKRVATVRGEKGWQMDRTSTLQSRSGAAREFKAWWRVECALRACADTGREYYAELCSKLLFKLQITMFIDQSRLKTWLTQSKIIDYTEKLWAVLWSL